MDEEAPGHQSARLKYIKWDPKYLREKPFQLYADIPVDAPNSLRGNVAFEEGPVEKIQDVRAEGEEFTLNTHGFVFSNFQTSFTDWEDNDAVHTDFYREMQQLLKQRVDGADLVHVFEHRLRRSDSNPAPGTTVNLNDPTRYLSPAGTVHIDLTAWEVLEKIKLFAKGDETLQAKILSGRVRVINVWRPLYDDIKSWPLAVGDGSLIQETDLTVVDQVRRYSRGEGYVVRYRPGYKWYYLSNMRRDEVLLLKNFDTADVPAKFAPHAAFRLHDTLEEVPKRTSVEVRALVFTFPAESRGGDGFLGM